MSDIIQILPDNIANQIAAGEVVQRPASVVKELVENAVDAGSSSIKVNITDGGKTLIQVIDNGCGMSTTDARLAFERHATSKIKKTDDLFAIRTMGFRGEALASIVAIANVEIKTKRIEDEVGTHIIMEGSDLLSQEAVACCNGTNICVKNLFFNVPARRRFLKATSTEYREIIKIFYRIVLTYPDVAFQLIHNEKEILNLPISNIRQRIINIFGKKINNQLVSINTDTSIVKLSGFIGTPQSAKRKTNEQFFFVNNRYIWHPYFNNAVLQAYDKLLAPDTRPPYFIFFEVDPKIIDINIHPTKTEVKFEDERAIYQIIQASIREALGKFNIVPSIDFNEDTSVEIPIAGTQVDIEAPTIKVNPDFNPFETEVNFNPFDSENGYNPFQQKTSIENNAVYKDFQQKEPTTPTRKSVPKDWDKLYGETFDKEYKKEVDFSLPEEETTPQQIDLIDEKQAQNSSNFFQLKNKYILTPIRSGLMIIDQRKAHERILFEQFVKAMENKSGVVQQLLFPETIELNASDYTLLQVISEDIKSLGFDISEIGQKTFIINGAPADVTNTEPKVLLENLLENYRTNQLDVKVKVRENLAKALAKAAVIHHNKPLTNEEMSALVDQLFACDTPNSTPDGKPTISIVNTQELESRFK